MINIDVNIGSRARTLTSSPLIERSDYEKGRRN